MGESTATLSLVIKAKNLATTEVNKFSSSLKSLKDGALGGLNVGFLGAAGAAALLTGALVNGVKGAIDEEKGIARLGAALKANVPAWKGDFAAIDKAIDARMSLGFADDDLRDSLARIVPATHDVNRAFEVQRTAMDLARFKGIDLATATDALVKVEAGQYRALKSLGIVLRDGATQTEALAAVQKVAFGQADAYASTTAGKLETAQIKLNEAFEDLGVRLMPLVTAAADALSQTLDLSATRSMAQLAGETFKATARGRELSAQITGETVPNTELLARGMDALRKAGFGATKGLDSVTAANYRVAQSGAVALAAVQDEIDALKELQYIDRRRRSSGPGQNTGGNRGATPRAEGGWVGLAGPQVALMGERRPEYVSNTHTPPGASVGGLTITGVTQRDIIRMVDEGMYFRLQRRPS